MRWSEAKKWAGSHGYVIEKCGGIFLWFKKSNTSIHGEAEDLSKVAQDIYNDITNGVWVDYQREEAARKAAEDIHIDPK